MNGKRRNLLKNITDFRCGWPLEGKNTGNPAYYARATRLVGKDSSSALPGLLKPITTFQLKIITTISYHFYL